MSNVDFKKAVAGTVMARVFEVLEIGAFIMPPKIPVGKNETAVVTSCTDYEKALFTVADTVKKEHDNAVMKEIMGQKTVGEMATEKNASDYELLKDLFWNSICGRLDEADKQGGTMLGVRDGYKIVRSIKERESPSFSPGTDLLGSFLAAFSNRDEVHNCESCPGYDICDLPQKKIFKKHQ